MTISVLPDREAIYASYGLTCPPRIGTLRDPTRKTYGGALAAIAARLGTPYMPWQRYAADVAMEVDSDTGALVYRDITLLVPRQSGKTTLILSVKVHRALAMGAQAKRYAPAQGTRQRILYSAQTGKDAREKFVDDHLEILNASPYKSRFRPRLTSGSEALRWDTGAYDGITANTEKAGHGKTLDLGIEDEFWAAEDARMEQAFSPAMITRWSPQHWRVSTEGYEKSVYLAEKVDRGREIVERGGESSVCYLEWSNLDGPVDDPNTWLSCMPALGHTVTVQTIAGELEKMGREEFERAYLNRRKGSRPKPDANIPSKEEWNAIANPTSTVSDPVAIALDITPSRDHGAIAIAGMSPDGKLHWEIIDHRPGTGWMVPRAQELRDRWTPVAVALDVAGPAGSLLVPLEEAGFTRPTAEPEHGQLAIPSAREAAAACGAFADAVRQKKAVHRAQVPFDTAFAGARTRPLGDSWAWARRAASADISPLVAATLAGWAFETRKHLAAPKGNAWDHVH